MQLTPTKHYKYKLDGQWYIGELDDIGYLHPLAVSTEENGQFEPVSILDPICTGEVDIIIAKEVDNPNPERLRGIDGVYFHDSILS